MKWEYKIIDDYSGNEFSLNMPGEDGWEVVSAHESFRMGFFKILLKRPKPEKPCST